MNEDISDEDRSGGIADVEIEIEEEDDELELLDPSFFDFSFDLSGSSPDLQALQIATITRSRNTAVMM